MRPFSTPVAWSYHSQGFVAPPHDRAAMSQTGDGGAETRGAELVSLTRDVEAQKSKLLHIDEEDSSKTYHGDAVAVDSSPTSLKWGILGVLVLQNASASLLMRCAAASQSSGEEWNAQTGVIMQEVLKGLACTFILIFDGTLHLAFSNKTEALKTAIPAILYLLQNNLQYFAIAYLDASTFAVLYQLKIVSSALLSVLLLRRRLTKSQWTALFLLSVGASFVALSRMPDQQRASEGSITEFIWGIVAVLLSCLTSGLAGVYFEKLLKGSTVSLWARNLQMSMYCFIIGVGSLVASGSSLEGGFFKGYSFSVWSAIWNNATGGLLVAVVIKYADNILKCFATSLAIILTTLASALVFHTAVTGLSTLGTALVIYSVFIYASFDPWSLFESLGGCKLDGSIYPKLIRTESICADAQATGS